MKTLTIQTNGKVKFNVDDVSFITDVNDVHILTWAKNALNQIINQLELSGSNYVHFEDDGYNTLYHIRHMGVVKEWTDPIPDVFTNLERMHSEYVASVEAADGN